MGGPGWISLSLTGGAYTKSVTTIIYSGFSFPSAST